MKQGDPCPFCRKVVTGYELGKWSSSTGAAGLWPASLKNLSELASGEGFNDYFRDSFNGNEATWRRWKEFLDVLGIEGEKRESIETQVLRVTNSKDLVKLRALVELCSKEFFDDQSLSVVVWRRIMEVLEAEKNGGEVNSKQDEEQILRKLEILDACFALGNACNEVRDFEEARRYLKRAKDGYEEQLGRDSEKALDASLLAAIITSDDERIENFRDLLKRCERALGEENVVTLATLS